MVKITVIADDYYVAQNLNDIASMVENDSILDEVYDGKKKKIEIEEYNCTIERVDETDKPTHTCPHCGETLEQGDDVYIDCFDGSRIRVTVTEIGEGIIVGVDAEGKSHWGNPKDVTKITEQ